MARTEKDITITVIGGGSGCLSIEDYLLDITPNVIGITGIHDNGGHSGEIRSVLGLLPPGDATHRMAIRIRDLSIRELFTHRWKIDSNHAINGHRPANEWLAAAEHKCGSHSKGIKLVEKMLNTYIGKVVPVSDDNVHLKAILTTGDIIEGEDKVDQRESCEPSITDIAFTPQNPSPNFEAIESIYNSNVLIIAPGSWWTSIRPILRTPGICEAIRNSGVPVIWCCNTVTNYSETHGYKASDFARGLKEEIGKEIDHAILNVIDHGVPANYAQEGSFAVEADEESCQPYAKKIYTGSFTEVCNIEGKLVIRHHGETVGRLIMDIIKSKRYPD